MAKKKKATQEVPADKDQAYELLKKQLKKDFGEGALLNLGNEDLNHEFQGDCLSTGCISLDLALGNPIPLGRFVEIYGPESSGKTTLALQCLANAQKMDERRVAAVDVEHALDIGYAAHLGLDLERADISQPEAGEDALNILEKMARSGAYSVLVLDSVSALVPKAEIEGDVGDHHVGTQARLMSQACRKLSPVCHETNTTIIFINQIRMKIGVMFGSPETTSGGQALKFYTSQRMDIRRIGVNKNNEGVPYSITSKVKVVKNKVAPPFKETELELLFGEGFNRTGDIINLASNLGIVEKNGSWYSYGEQRIGQGITKAIDYLKQNPEIEKEIADRIKEIHS